MIACTGAVQLTNAGFVHYEVKNTLMYHNILMHTFVT